MSNQPVTHIRDLLTEEEYAEHRQLALSALKLERQGRDLARKIAEQREPKSLQQIADRLGVSKERIRQIEKVALFKLSHLHPELKN